MKNKLINNDTKVSQNVEAKNFTIQADAGILDILASSIYKDPINAPIRELIANACDAHVAAGIPDKAIAIEVPTIDNEYVFSVRDYGTGLTQEQVMGLYSTFGASTKGSDENQAGFMGIGSKSPFAYTDMFYVESFNDGKITTYCCYRDNAALSISVMHEEPTDEPSGLRVWFNVQHDDDVDFECAIGRTASFLNVRPTIVNKSDIAIHNGTEVLLDCGEGIKILKPISIQEYDPLVKMGPLVYKWSTWGVTSAIQKLRGNSEPLNLNSNSVIEVPIGYFDITASRNSIRMSERTIAQADKLVKLVAAKVKDFTTSYLAEKKAIGWNDTVAKKSLLAYSKDFLVRSIYHYEGTINMPIDSSELKAYIYETVVTLDKKGIWAKKLINCDAVSKWESVVYGKGSPSAKFFIDPLWRASEDGMLVVVNVSRDAILPKRLPLKIANAVLDLYEDELDALLKEKLIQWGNGVSTRQYALLNRIYIVMTADNTLKDRLVKAGLKVNEELSELLTKASGNLQKTSEEAVLRTQKALFAELIRTNRLGNACVYAYSNEISVSYYKCHCRAKDIKISDLDNYDIYDIAAEDVRKVVEVGSKPLLTCLLVQCLSDNYAERELERVRAAYKAYTGKQVIFTIGLKHTMADKGLDKSLIDQVKTLDKLYSTICPPENMLKHLINKKDSSYFNSVLFTSIVDMDYPDKDKLIAMRKECAKSIAVLAKKDANLVYIWDSFLECSLLKDKDVLGVVDMRELDNFKNNARATKTHVSEFYPLAKSSTVLDDDVKWYIKRINKKLKNKGE